MPASALLQYAPMKDLIRPTVLGSGYVARVFRRWGLEERESALQIQPRIVVVLGLMMVLWADKRRLQLCRACRTLFQLQSSSWGVLLPQNKSSAILATDPSCSNGPRTRHITSSRAVSKPGIPIAERT